MLRGRFWRALAFCGLERLATAGFRLGPNHGVCAPRRPTPLGPDQRPNQLHCSDEIPPRPRTRVPTRSGPRLHCDPRPLRRPKPPRDGRHNANRIAWFNRPPVQSAPPKAIAPLQSLLLPLTTTCDEQRRRASGSGGIGQSSATGPAAAPTGSVRRTGDDVAQTQTAAMAHRPRWPPRRRLATVAAARRTVRQASTPLPWRLGCAESSFSGRGPRHDSTTSTTPTTLPARRPTTPRRFNLMRCRRRRF